MAIYTSVAKQASVAQRALVTRFSNGGAFSVATPPNNGGGEEQSYARYFSDSDGSQTITLNAQATANMSAPFPTNYWFTNMMIKQDSSVCGLDPYNVKAKGTTLEICHPSFTEAGSGNGNPSFYRLESFVADWAITTSETLDHRELQSDYSSFHCINRWVQSAGSNYMESPMVLGSPYITIKYNGLTPKFTTVHAILDINSQGASDGNYTGTKFKISLNSGDTWLIYASESITLTKASSVLTATSSLTGHVRFAELVTGTNVETLFDTYKSAIPVGATVSHSVTSNTASVTFNWDKEGTGSLLMCTQTHHEAGLTTPSSYEDIQFRSATKGNTKAVIGDTWSFSYSLPTLDYELSGTIDAGKVSTIETALASDYNESYSINDPYFGGKKVQRAGLLATIANQLGDTTTRDSILTTLKSKVEPWLNGTSTPNLVYDITFGGIVTERGLSDSGQDFGNARYNDHHFHYGYWYAGLAHLVRFDSTWGATYKNKIYDMVKDVMNTDENNPNYPILRNFSWYHGHSWASGLYDFGDGQNQESVSEAVNCYYGAYILGKAYGDTDLQDLGRVLHILECESANAYWYSNFLGNKHLSLVWDGKGETSTTFFGGNLEFSAFISFLPYNRGAEEMLRLAYVESAYGWYETIYNRANTAATATLSGGVITGTTVTNGGGGFGKRPPSVTVTGDGSGANLKGVLNTDGELASIVITSGGSGYTTATLSFSPNTLSDGWNSFLISFLAIADADKAWTQATALSSVDDGYSKTAMLYWIATRTNDYTYLEDGGGNYTLTGDFELIRV